jgi:hypothetical protein
VRRRWTGSVVPGAVPSPVCRPGRRGRRPAPTGLDSRRRRRHRSTLNALVTCVTKAERGVQVHRLWGGVAIEAAVAAQGAVDVSGRAHGRGLRTARGAPARRGSALRGSGRTGAGGRVNGQALRRKGVSGACGAGVRTAGRPALAGGGGTRTGAHRMERGCDGSVGVERQERGRQAAGAADYNLSMGSSRRTCQAICIPTLRPGPLTPEVVAGSLTRTSAAWSGGSS